MSRAPLRIAGVLAAVIMVISLIAGCAQATPTPAAKSEPAAKTEAKPAEAKPTTEATKAAAPAKATEPAKPVAMAQSVTIVMSQEPDTLLQSMGSMYAASAVKQALGTETQNTGTACLVLRNDKNEIIPNIAESVPTLENGGAKFVGEGEDKHLEVTFKLRKDVKWQDGQPVTSADVRFWWETMMDPDFGVASRDDEIKLADVATPDDYTVVFKLLSQKQARAAAQNGYMKLPKEEYAQFAQQEGPVTIPLYNRYGAVMPKHAYGSIPAKDLAKSEFARKPIGMGPYILKDWVAGQSITLEANPNYFKGAPKIKTVVFKFVPDTNTILAQLQTGQVDVVTEDAFQATAIPDLDRIGAQGLVKPYYIPAQVWEHVDLNLDNEFLKDVNVRKAIIYGIDRKSIVDNINYGKVPVIHTWITPDNMFYEDNVTKYEYNKDKAKQLLADAGFKPGPDGIMVKDGKPLKLLLQTTAGNKARELTTQIIQQNLKDIGIAVDLDYMPSKNFFATEGQGPLNARTFQMALYAWVSNDDPGGMDIYHSKNIPSKQNNFSGQNFPGWRNPKADAALATANSELEMAKRKAAYSEHQKLFAEDVPVVPLFQRLNISVAKTALKNFKPTPTQTAPTWNIQEWELPAQ